VENYVSAEAFIDVLDNLQKKVREEEASEAGTVSQSLLVQLASVNQPFVEHCRRLQWYALDFAVRWMCKYVLRDEYQKDPEAAQQKALDTGNAFLRSGYFSHGQMLTAKDLRRRPEMHLKIEELGKDDPTWRLIWQVHCACEVLFSLPVGSNVSKLFESSRTTFPIY
jgi:hypothetical protein